jgi:hypothetical protein
MAFNSEKTLIEGHIGIADVTFWLRDLELMPQAEAVDSRPRTIDDSQIVSEQSAENYERRIWRSTTSTAAEYRTNIYQGLGDPAFCMR